MRLAAARRGALWLTALAALVLASCGSSSNNESTDERARVVELPGAAGEIDFDDIVYSKRLQRVLVPARESGLYLVDPQTDEVERLGNVRSADSVDDGGGVMFVLDRTEGKVMLLDPEDGRVRDEIEAEGGDYIRYTATTGELWVTEPGASRIEILEPGPPPRSVGFIPVPEGPEGLELNSSRRIAYTHAGSDLVAIDIDKHAVTARWPTGCRGTHGFPRVDNADGFVMASCSHDGEVVLLDLDDGDEVGRYQGGDGESLPGYSAATGHFYVRGDPGRNLATLEPSTKGLARIAAVDVPEIGHCLTADEFGNYWTCDADKGRLLHFKDSARSKQPGG